MGRKYFFLAGTVAAGFMFFSCAEPPERFMPPLLLSKSGLAGLVELYPESLLFGTACDASFPEQQPFGGHILGAGGPATVSLRLRVDNPEARPALAVYGPRAQNGLFGAALTFTGRSRDAEAGLLDIELGRAGDYLVLLADLASTGAGYRLLADCSLGCGAPSCPPLPCGIYCEVGLAREVNGCPRCECAAACGSDADCPRESLCRDGACRREDPCGCNEPYNPVCGADGHTYANTCELACLGVSLDHPGPCDLVPQCASNSDCPPGMTCENKVCVPACECSGLGLDPVCGTDRVSYPNDCERKCAGAGLDHLGSCGECNPELCDGTDNDCDGSIDEDCFQCGTDAECPQSMICWASTCVGIITCTSDHECPIGQICLNGLCRGQNGCGPEDCDGIDNDCDNQTDEGCPACHTFADCDDGNPCTQDQCQAQTGCQNFTVADGTLCDDGDPCTVQDICYQGSCVGSPFGQDADGDGYRSCVDCDDTNAAIHPGALEVCDGVDNDCNGVADDGCLSLCSSDADCAAKQVCRQGVCVNTCTTDSDCPLNLHCLQGICAP